MWSSDHSYALAPIQTFISYASVIPLLFKYMASTQEPSKYLMNHVFAKCPNYYVMSGKYPWNINRVGVEVDRGSKVFKMRDVQGYPRATHTVHF